MCFLKKRRKISGKPQSLFSLSLFVDFFFALTNSLLNELKLILCLIIALYCTCTNGKLCFCKKKKKTAQKVQHKLCSRYKKLF